MERGGGGRGVGKGREQGEWEGRTVKEENREQKGGVGQNGKGGGKEKGKRMGRKEKGGEWNRNKSSSTCTPG